MYVCMYIHIQIYMYVCVFIYMYVYLYYTWGGETSARTAATAA